jgi:hypothetical protein
MPQIVGRFGRPPKTALNSQRVRSRSDEIVGHKKLGAN